MFARHMDMLITIVVGYLVMSAILGSIALWTNYEFKQEESERRAADKARLVE